VRRQVPSCPPRPQRSCTQPEAVGENQHPNIRDGYQDLARDRFLAWAIVNDDHFVAPGALSPLVATRTHSAPAASTPRSSPIIGLHEVAFDEAYRLGHCRGDEYRAMAREAAASTISQIPSPRGTGGFPLRPSATIGITGTHIFGKACNAKSPPTRPQRYASSSHRRRFSLMAFSLTEPMRQ
jgi:hypothetical protein